MIHLSFARPAEKPIRILCLGAHSDDIEIGCGATLLSLVAAHRAISIKWVVFGATGIRETEARASAGMMLAGAEETSIEVLGFPDAFFPHEGSAIKREFNRLGSEFAPDVVFTHRGDDRHQDHRVISELTWNTFRNHLILEYEIPKYDGDLGQPNVFVPIEDAVRRQKIELLDTCFGSQRAKSWFSAETFDAVMRIRGVECASPTGYAEGFYARKLSLAVC